MLALLLQPSPTELGFWLEPCALAHAMTRADFHSPRCQAQPDQAFLNNPGRYNTIVIQGGEGQAARLTCGPSAVRLMASARRSASITLRGLALQVPAAKSQMRIWDHHGREQPVRSQYVTGSRSQSGSSVRLGHTPTQLYDCSEFRKLG